ncbi:NUDIX hydrolase [Candidatus Parcubacteria bacterium]|nr:NUDIX hydrolase [Candidatus Parcubacteria bacterium]
MKNWKTIKSKVAFKCKYMKVLEEDFLAPDKKKYKYYILKKNDYVVVVARENNFLYLINFYRYTTKSRDTEFVAGAVEKNETPLMAAKKELKEEAGIMANKIKKIGWYYAFRGSSDQKGHVFLAEDLKFCKQELEDLEKAGEMKVVKLKISELRKMIELGKIKDVDTVAAFNMFMLKK